MDPTEQWVMMPGDMDGLSSHSPPAHVREYASKPLPSLPLRARSVASSLTSEIGQVFTSEVSQALSSPKTSTHDDPVMFDWEVESSTRSVRLHQSLGPDDMIPMTLRSRKLFFSALEADLIIPLKPTVVASRAVSSTAGLERRIAQATEGPDPRPPFVHRHTLPAALSIISPPAVPPDEILSPQTKSSVQKILKLTGNMSPTTSLSTDTPSLHNSTQKIRQLTGLDYGPRRDSEYQLQTLQEELSDCSSESSLSLYWHEIVEEPVDDEPAESTCSQSYVESIHEIITPLAAAPRYITPAPAPPPVEDNSPHEEEFPIVVKEALQLSGFIAADVGVLTPEERTPNTGRPESWDAYSEREIHSSSSSEVSELEFEMEPTVAELYHDSAVAIAKSSPLWSPSGKGDVVGDVLSPIPKHMGWDSKHQTSNAAFTPSPRGSTHGSTGSTTVDSTLSRSSSLSRPFSISRFRKKDNLSERRGHAPSPLETVSSSSSSWGKQFQRTPYPPVSSSIRATVEEAEDGQARLSLLARIFTTAGGSSMSIHRRNSNASSASGPTPSLMSARSPDRTTPTTSNWSPDTPSPGTVTFGDASRSSIGLLARTMEQARNATGRRSKIDQAEARRGSLRGKIKVLRDHDDSTIDLERFSRSGFKD
ncbi:hypothetical protein N0V93_003821 [Gnomoniopsis smithogilvyi]|uniref:Uncharacterized protein n=1 Tax=Gnomoniopsis smithogilvyi TaxID=1191159 RepID=A0A9W9D079_9PEZI|nr:hypothetical protein N0V93_003821 [Gnomoniopsis smithogilvyi]